MKSFLHGISQPHPFEDTFVRVGVARDKKRGSGEDLRLPYDYILAGQPQFRLEYWLD